MKEPITVKRPDPSYRSGSSVGLVELAGPTSLPIAIDAMGGDRAPAEIVAGAIDVVRSHGLSVILVGQASEIEPLLAEFAATGRPTVIVAHKAVLRALLSLATGWTMLGKPPVRLLPNTAHRFLVQGSGRLVVDQMNIPLLGEGAAGPHPDPLPVGEREGSGASTIPE